MRRALVAGNWKLHGSVGGAQSLTASVRVGAPRGADVALCPTFVHVGVVGAEAAGSSIAIGAQDISDEVEGAFTGEVAGWMLAELGCRYAIVGHSERRARHHETNEGVAAKARAGIEAGLAPIVCVGESFADRDAGRADAVVWQQLEPVLALGGRRLDGVVIAYEPVWAIGTGRAATTEQAQAMHAVIRSRLASVDSGLAERTRIVYGGSVKPDNAGELFAQPDIDGALVGGASLDADKFLAICRAASPE